MKLLTVILALSSISTFASEQPRTFSDLSPKTNKVSTKGYVSDRLVLLNTLPGSVVLRVCVSKASHKSATYMSIKLNSTVPPLFDEYLDDREASKSDDFVKCKDTEFPSFKSLNNKTLLVATQDGASRSVYVEVFNKEKPSASWPVLAKVAISDENNHSFMAFDFHAPNP